MLGIGICTDFCSFLRLIWYCDIGQSAAFAFGRTDRGLGLETHFIHAFGRPFLLWMSLLS